MTVDVKDAIAALRRSHDEMTAFVEGLSLDRLERGSGCSEWSVAAVLSHLGSQAEIGYHTLMDGKADLSAAPAIWDRWNGMTPVEQARGFVASDAQLVDAYEALDDEGLANKKIDVGFLPAPVDIKFLASMRLTELGLHRWDVQVAFDPNAVVPDYIVPIVLEQLPVFAGFFAKTIGRAVTVGISTIEPERHYRLEIRDDGVSLTEGVAAQAEARLSIPAEALLRLTSGRLDPDHTPGSVRVEGDMALDELRRLFPGY
jgi:uncharacterized protein (TIGR03083 family)